MSGFPIRISANALGPRMKNRGTARSPVYDVSAERMNLMRWQIAGLSQTAPLAWVVVVFTAPDIVTVVAHGNAWQGQAPKVERLATGAYLVTYAALVKDDDGIEVPVNLVGASVSPRLHAPKLFGDWDIANGREVTVQLVDKSETPTDGGFLLSVY